MSLFTIKLVCFKEAVFENNEDFHFQKHEKFAIFFCVTILIFISLCIKVEIKSPDLMVHSIMYNVACKKKKKKDLH